MIYTTALQIYPQDMDEDIERKLHEYEQALFDEQIAYKRYNGHFSVDPVYLEKATMLAEHIVYGIGKKRVWNIDKYLGWVAVATGLGGQWLVTNGSYWGFVIWFFGNGIWIYRAGKKADYPSIALFTIYNFMNIFGFISWLYKN